MTTNTKKNVEVKATEQVQGKESLQALQSIMANNKIQTFHSASSGRGGFISVVKSPNGTRLTISKKVNKELGYPKELFIGFDNEYLVIFNADGLDGGNIRLDKNEKDILKIYNTNLVNIIIDEFNLDYTDRTSRSFSDGHFKDQGRPVLYVKMV